MKKYMFLLFLNFSIVQANASQSINDSLLINDLFKTFQENNLVKFVDTTGILMGGPSYNEIILQGYNADDQSQKCELSIQKSINKESELANVRAEVRCDIPIQADPNWCGEDNYDSRCATSTKSGSFSFGKLSNSSLVANELDKVELLNREKVTIPNLLLFSTEKEKKTSLLLQKTNGVVVATYKVQPSKDDPSFSHFNRSYLDSSLFANPYSNFVFIIPNK